MGNETRYINHFVNIDEFWNSQIFEKNSNKKSTKKKKAQDYRMPRKRRRNSKPNGYLKIGPNVCYLYSSETFEIHIKCLRDESPLDFLLL